MDDNGGAQSPFSARLLWERQPGQARTWAGKAVLGFILNGAQGDDDEAHGGHFAVVAGRFEPKGEMGDWMVNNFYDLDHESEKGILPAMVPMDNYLMDLNSGQAYYRPSYLLVVVLSQDRPARRFQSAIQAAYNHFYRHDLLYHHSSANCAGISLDTLRSIGREIPRRGATGFLKGIGVFLYVSVTDWSVAAGEKLFDYLTEERTRLFPRVAFEAAGEDLLQILQGPTETLNRELTAYEQMLQDDVEAVIFVRIPQIPSSRAFGTYPVASFDEYRQRVPTDPSSWKRVHVTPRPFPPYLRDFPPPSPRRSFAIPATMVTGFFILANVGVGWYALVHRRARKAPPCPARPQGDEDPQQGRRHS